jgi:hypothetical protein
MDGRKVTHTPPMTMRRCEMDKKYVAKTVVFTQLQLDVLVKAKASMEKNFGVTLSFSQVLTMLAVQYIKEV